MAIMRIAAFILLILFLHFHSSNCSIDSTDCEFCYLRQPVESLDCNPYNARGVVTECVIERPTNSPQLEIKWFKDDTQLINSSNYTISETIYSVSTIKITSQLSILSVVLQGRYWCQVFHQNQALESISNVIEITTRDDYERDSNCINVKAQNKQNCYDIFDEPYATCPSSPSSPALSPSPSSSLVLTKPTMSTMMILPSSAYDVISQTQFILNTEDAPFSSSFPSTENALMTQDDSIIVSATPSVEGIKDLPETHQTWLYVVIGLAATFCILIIVLCIICIALCLTQPKTNRSNVIRRQRRCERSTKTVSTTASDNILVSRPHTAMTIDTDISIAPLPMELDNGSSFYDVLDQDYEDVDEGDKLEDMPSPTQLVLHPRYLEQGPPGLVNLSHPPLHPTYSEIGESSTPINEIFANRSILTMNNTSGYGKLDHSRSRQNYYPKKDSPLLSGYRKLEHVQGSFKATTLPNQPQPGYANIEVPTTNNHLRSASLPNSEYSNLNPTSPTVSQENTQDADHTYINFEIVEAFEETDHSISPLPRPLSEDDYHMLADATAEQQKDYEFLPTYTCEDDIPEIPHLTKSRPYHCSINSHALAKLPVGEQISLGSSCSADFTGPFFFPHMIESDTIEPDHHTYRALDVSTMEPKQSYTFVNIKKSNHK